MNLHSTKLLIIYVIIYWNNTFTKSLFFPIKSKIDNLKLLWIIISFCYVADEIVIVVNRSFFVANLKIT